MDNVKMEFYDPYLSIYSKHSANVINVATKPTIFIYKKSSPHPPTKSLKDV